MFHRRILKAIAFLSIVNYVKSQADITSLPICGDMFAPDPNGVCKTSEGETIASQKYCINAEKTTLYKTDTNCVPQELVDRYYVFLCSDANTCALKENDAGNVGDLTQSSATVLVYKSEDGDLTQVKNNEYYYSGSTTKRLIECKKNAGGITDFHSYNGKCTVIKNTDASLGKVYLNPGTSSTETIATKPLVKFGTDTLNVQADVAVAPPSGGSKSYYIDESSLISGSDYGKLIQCTDTTHCTSSFPGKGTYLDAISSADNAKFSNMIRCDDTKCARINCSNDGLIYTNSDVSQSPDYYICGYAGATNAGKFYKLSSTSGYFLHEDGSLIGCTSGGCSKVMSPSTTKVYLDEGKKVTSGNIQKVIQCTSATSCSNIAGTDKDVFINAAGNGITNAIITCTATTCTAGNAAAGTTFYIDKINTSNKKIIQCSNGVTGVDDGCVSVSGNTDPGVAYIDKLDAKNIIKLTGSGFVSAVANSGSDPLYFIDGADVTKIITCATSDADCASATPGYYDAIRAYFTDGLDNNRIITCTDGTGGSCISSKGLQICSAVTAESSCESANAAMDENTYCIHTDGFIYLSHPDALDRKREAGASCRKQDTFTGIKVFTDENEASDDDGYIYNCDASHICTQIHTLGHYIEGSAIYTSVGDSVYTKQASPFEGKYFLIDESALVHCTGDTIASDCTKTTTGIDDGYYVNGAVSSNVANALIYCKDDHCQLKTGVDKEFYVNAGADKTTKKFIACTTGGGCVASNAIPHVAEGYYVDTVTGTNIIHCETVDDEIICTTSAHGVSSATNPEYYLQGHSDSTKKQIIKCINNACAVVSNPLKGYYKNKDTANSKAIACNGDYCQEVEGIVSAADCTGASVGQLIDTGSALKICFASSEAAVEIKSDSTCSPTYKTITLENASDFPGAKTTKISVKVDKEGRAFILEETKLPQCSSSVTGPQYCTVVSGGNEKIRLGNGSDAGADITLDTVFGETVVTAAGVYAAYFDDDFAVQTTPSGTASMSYLCTFTGGNALENLEKCVLFKGYANIPTNLVYCNGWRGDYCGTATAATNNDCASNTVVGNPSQDNSNLCFKNNAVLLPSSGTTEVHIYTETVNEYFGIPGASYFSISLTKKPNNTNKIATVTTDNSFIANTSGLQVNRAVSGVFENALLECTGTSCTVRDGKEGYFLNGDTDKATNKLIYCTLTGSAGCKPATSTANSYYIYPLSTSQIIHCNGENVCSIIGHEGTQYAPKHYLSNPAGGKVITCTPSGCFYEHSDIKGYFLNGAGTTGKSLIKCDGSGTCSLLSDSNLANYADTVGKVKVDSDGKVKMCVAVGCSGFGEVTIVNGSSEPIYKTVTVGAGVFPGVAGAGSISVKFANDGSVVLLATIDVDYASHIKGNIPTSSNAKGSKIFYFEKPGDSTVVSNQEVTANTLPTDDLIAFQCTYDTSDNLDDTDSPVFTLQAPCRRVLGYASLPNGQVIHCTGWRRDGCVLTILKSCEAGDEGKLGSGKKLCFNTDTINLPSTSATQPVYTAFLPFDINSNYGKIKSDNVVFLELTSSSVMAINPPTSEVGNVVTNTLYLVKEDEEFKLYTFTAHGTPTNPGTFALDDGTNNGVLAFKEIGPNLYIHYVDTSSILFDCYNGKCQKTEGYILLNTKIYTNIGKTVWDEVTEAKYPGLVIEEATACAGGDQKIKIVTTELEICVKASTSAHTGIYFLGEATDLKMYKFGKHIIGKVVPDDGFYLTKDGEVLSAKSTHAGSKIVKCENGTCSQLADPTEDGFYSNAAGNLLIKFAKTGTAYSLIDDAGYYIDVKNKLVYCDGSNNCAQSPKIGYFINTGDQTTNKYIQCTRTECEAIPLPTETTCGVNQIGQLVNDGGVPKLCLDQSIMIGFTTPNTYMVSHQTRSVFKEFINKNIYAGLVSGTATELSLKFDNTVTAYCVTKLDKTVNTKSSCTAAQEEYICNEEGVCMKVEDAATSTLPEPILNQKVIPVVKEEEENTSAADLKIQCNVLQGTNCSEKTYYLVDKSDYSILEEGVGALFYCEEEERPCQEIHNVGYYIIQSDLGYQCQETTLGLSCSKLPTLESECASSGDIIYDQNKLYLCISGTTSEAVELNSQSSGNYALPYGTSNVFGLPSGATNYALITIKDKNITLNTKYEKENKLKYVYADISNSNKIIDKSIDTCPTKTEAGNTVIDDNKIKELICENGKCHTLP